MIDSARLLKDLQKELKALTRDLTSQAEDPSVTWSRSLRDEYNRAFAAGRTSQTWPSWRDGEVDQAAVAWLIAATFVRFCEDNWLLDGAKTSTGIPAPWIAGPTSGPRGNRVERATEHATGYKLDHPASNDRHWWREAFGVLADLPAGRDLVDREHNPVWTADISAAAASRLLDFFRATEPDGTLRHDFTDESLDTRFLGDLYQDLSEYAKKTYALLQTPVFVEEFILDRTLEPAIGEFGLRGLKVIDPTCGSGHFLLGAFGRLLKHWEAAAPGLDARERVEAALDSIHGVDLNPFAVAIARFRLTVEALRATGEATLTQAPAFDYHLAIGDSLLGAMGHQGRLDLFATDEDEGAFQYSAEDLAKYHHILEHGRYHVVVGNPPYITPKDAAANETYRRGYLTCYRQYALSVPFMELFFRLARRAGTDGGAGYVGQITSNSFTKREFGKKLIEDFLSGRDETYPVDLTQVIDTSGAYIPGHGTPTVIVVGRLRFVQRDTVRAVLGVRGEPGQPVDASTGLVWSEIVGHLGDPSFDGTYVTVADLPRETLATHPWSLSGGGAQATLACLDASRERFQDRVAEIGFGAVTREDGAYMLGEGALRRVRIPERYRRVIVEGEFVRDHQITAEALESIWPYDAATLQAASDPAVERQLWPLRRILKERVAYGATQLERGLTWFEYSMFFDKRYRTPLSITFAEVATHNHFVLDRGGKVFKQTAPVIKLPEGATEEDHLALLGVLNSSTVCFWLKQVSYGKGNGGIGGGIGDESWEPRYAFNATKIEQLPLPASFPTDRARMIDGLAQHQATVVPAAALANTPDGLTFAAALATAREQWHLNRERLIFLQEELDWDVYRRYGLVEKDLTYSGDGIDRITLGERAFEIALARKVEMDVEQTAWFERHGSTPITALPASWPEDYRDLVGLRLAAIDANPHLRLLERPEYKRRWATEGWESLTRSALTAAILDRLEEPGLWRDGSGPTTRSVAELADSVRGNARLVEMMQLLAGRSDVDLVPALESLVAEESVPYLAALRYKPSGLEKYREWQRVWDLQRDEDRLNAGGVGTPLQIPVPPIYAPVDFRKPAYWKARGKLDVPKERFVVYPGVTRPGEPSTVLGWAGWDHGEQGLALSRLVGEVAGAGADDSTLRPLLAGLVELEPSIDQWHSEVDPLYGTSPAQAVKAFVQQLLDEHHLTRDDVTAWTPLASGRGRPRKERA